MLEPYRFEPEHVLDVADDDSSDDNETRKAPGALDPSGCKYITVTPDMCPSGIKF